MSVFYIPNISTFLLFLAHNYSTNIFHDLFLKYIYQDILNFQFQQLRLCINTVIYYNTANQSKLQYSESVKQIDFCFGAYVQLFCLLSYLGWWYSLEVSENTYGEGSGVRALNYTSSAEFKEKGQGEPKGGEAPISKWTTDNSCCCHFTKQLAWAGFHLPTLRKMQQ